MLIRLWCWLWGHATSTVDEDQCDGMTCIPWHTKNCQQDLPIEACARCGALFRAGKPYTERGQRARSR